MPATSINVHVHTLASLSRASCALGVTRRAIIVRLLMRIMHDIDGFRSGCGTVRYQPDDEREKWRCIPLKLNPDENEFFSDLRKLCKCSVSLLVALAVDRYLNEMLNGATDEYNYKLFKGYLIQKAIIDGLICWQLYWGRPKTLGQPQLE